MVATQTQSSPLPLTAFTADLAARVTGLSVSQLHRWDRNGFFEPSLADPDRRRPYSRIYSLPDVVALRTIAALRAAGVSFAELRTVRDLLFPDHDGEYPVRCLHIVDGHLFRTRSEAMAAAKSSQRVGEPTTVEIAAMVATVDEEVRRLSERTADQIGQVSRDRWIMNGVPVIAGTRIPTATIVWAHEHGYSLDRILEEYPRLKVEDVQAAIAFEQGGSAKMSDRELTLV